MGHILVIIMQQVEILQQQSSSEVQTGDDEWGFVSKCRMQVFLSAREAGLKRVRGVVIRRMRCTVIGDE